MGRLFQLDAALRKNALQKRRSLRVTLCEALSPLCLMWLLSYGYFMSHVNKFNERNYAEFVFSIPEEINFILEPLDVENTDALVGIATVFNKLMKGPLPPPTLDQFVLTSNAISSQFDVSDLDLLLETEAGRGFTNLLFLGTVHLAPAGPGVDAFVAYALKHTTTFGQGYFKHRIHASEKDALEFIDAYANPAGSSTKLNVNATTERTWCLIVFDELQPGHVDYTLRFNYSTVPHTGVLVSWISLGLDDRYQRYYFSGFHSVSQLVDDFAFDYTSSNAPPANAVGGDVLASTLAWAFETNGVEAPNGVTEQRKCTPPSWLGVPFPIPAYNQNLFFLSVGYLLGLVLTMSTLFPMSRLVKELVEEKESRMRQTMAAMGMHLGVNAFAWWFTASVLFTWLATVMTAMAKWSFFPHSDFAVTFVFFELLLLSEVSLSFLVAACFSRARLASIVGPVVLFAAALPRYIFFGSNRYENTLGKKLASASSVAAFCFGADIFADYEYAEVGVSWENYTEGDYSMQTCLLAMAVDTAAYLVLALYLEAVLPTEHGSPRHPLFFLSPLISAVEKLCFRSHSTSTLPSPSPVRVGQNDEENDECSDDYNDDDDKGGEDEEEQELRASRDVTTSDVRPATELEVAQQLGERCGGGGGVGASSLATSSLRKKKKTRKKTERGAYTHSRRRVSGDDEEQQQQQRKREREGEVDRQPVERVDPSVMGPPAVRILGLVKDYHAPTALAASLGRLWASLRGIVVPYPPSSQEGARSWRARRAPAVDGLSLDLWAGQVTCLLGHNGAGKSTTVSMLTGLTPPTQGDCVVFGRSVVSDLSAVRQQLGVCPQTNVLFPNLTVEEHLTFFARVKGVTGPAVIADAVAKVIAEVGLTEKVDVPAGSLSGGMKRKLCLAMALIGDPKVLYLDEPTSGMDPYSRRATWELVRRAKAGRVVVLTTHFMDEAEVLGDRVAIMSRGRLRCAGSPLWLKARFGIGYNLSISLVRESGALAAASAPGGGFEREKGHLSAGDKQEGELAVDRHPVGEGKEKERQPSVVGSEGSRADNGGGGGTDHELDPLAAAVERSLSGDYEQVTTHGDLPDVTVDGFVGHGYGGGGAASQVAGGGLSPTSVQVSVSAEQVPEPKKTQGSSSSSFSAASGNQLTSPSLPLHAAAGGGVTDLVLRHVPSAEVVSCIAREVTFRLPRSATGRFVALFEALETVGRTSLGVGAFGLSVTTLEEVFIRIAHEEEEEGDQNARGGHAHHHVPTPHHQTEGEEEGEDDAGAEEGRGRGARTTATLASVRYSAASQTDDDDDQHRVCRTSRSSASLDRPQTAPPSQAASTSHPRSLSTAQPVRLLKPSPSRQIRILFGKRATVFRRDLKGAFFQLVVPLMLVAAIMSILTVRVEPAGPSLRGLPSAFRRRSASSVAVTSNTLQNLARNNTLAAEGNGEEEEDFCEAYLLPKLEKELEVELPRGGSGDSAKPPSWLDGITSPYNTYGLGKTSYNVSDHLLDTYNDPGARFGAFVSQDEFPTTFIVDWNATLRALPRVLAASSSVGALDWLQDWATAQAPFHVESRTLTVSELEEACDTAEDAFTGGGADDPFATTCDLIRSVPKDRVEFELSLNPPNSGLTGDEAEGLIAQALNLTVLLGGVDDERAEETQALILRGLNETLGVATRALRDLLLVRADDDDPNNSSLTLDLFAVVDLLNGAGLLDTSSSGNSNGTAVLNLPPATQDLLDSLVGLFNASNLGELLDSDGATLSFGFGVNNETTFTLPSATIGFNTLRIADEGQTLKVTDVQVVFNEGGDLGLRANTTLSLGNATLSTARLLALLAAVVGQETVVYNLNVASPFTLTVLHNSSAWHGLFMFHGLARQEAYANQCLANNASTSSSSSAVPEEAFSYVARNHPLPLTTRQVLEIRFVLSVFASLFVLIALCYVPAAFTAFVVKERQCKSKHLQVVSGGSVYLYWLATYLWDSFLFLLLTLCLIGILSCYGTEAAMVFLHPFEAAVCTFLLVFFFGLSTVPFNYVLSFAFDDHNQALIAIRVVNFIVGFAATIVFVILFSIPSTKKLAIRLRRCFLIFPPYQLGEGFLRLSRTFFTNNVLGGNVPVFSWEVAGSPLVYMATEAVVYVAFTLALETSAMKTVARALDRRRVARFFSTQRQEEGRRGPGGEGEESGEEDQDVAAEAEHSRRLIEAWLKRGQGRESERTSGAGEKAGGSPSLPALSKEEEEEEEEEGASAWSADDAAILLSDFHKVYPPPLSDELAHTLEAVSPAALAARCCPPPPADEAADIDDDEEEEKEGSDGGGGGGGKASSKVEGGAGSGSGAAAEGVPGFKHAVRGLSLAVPKGETFGFLGINGAGKTTTMSVLTGALDLSSGHALVAGRDVAGHSSMSHSSQSSSSPSSSSLVGYCPQEDPLLEFLTGYETLELFARLKGVGAGSEEALAEAVTSLLQRVGLLPFKDEPCGGYSGGMKRKLSFAVALVGEPPVLFLDEPSTGMDPVARRHMWDAIAAAAPGRSIILTTHSMEECEALCSRVGIMVGGKFKCLGSVPHLKSRFSRALQIELRCRPDDDDDGGGGDDSGEKGLVSSGQEAHEGGGEGGQRKLGSGSRTAAQAVAFIQKIFPHAQVDEWHGRSVKLRVALNDDHDDDEEAAAIKDPSTEPVTRGDHARKSPAQTTQTSPSPLSSSSGLMSRAFRVIEERRSELGIEDYSVTQGTLEQVFIHFAKQQSEEKGHIAGMSYSSGAALPTPEHSRARPPTPEQPKSSSQLNALPLKKRVDPAEVFLATLPLTGFTASSAEEDSGGEGRGCVSETAGAFGTETPLASRQDRERHPSPPHRVDEKTSSSTSGLELAPLPSSEQQTQRLEPGRSPAHQGREVTASPRGERRAGEVPAAARFYEDPQGHRVASL